MRSDWFFLGRDFAIRTISMETVISSVKINLLGSFFAKMRALTRFLFVVLVAKFAGFRE